MDYRQIEEKFKAWEQVSKTVENYVNDRNFQEVSRYVNAYLDELKMIILLCNGYETEDIVDFSQFDQLAYTPINVTERLDFIEKRKHHRHAYIQLNELYKEMKKKYVTGKIKGEI
ncbi:YpoC family protein [Alkalibacillus aidingensis]|uniref:YpoC family protein n=1 Tax=Alkalibacillus aidingensis TaxID=2747607 RepID=UPI001660EEF2|nr:hypothetical protein [Alkalibacillus aidingensis]